MITLSVFPIVFEAKVLAVAVVEAKTATKAEQNELLNTLITILMLNSYFNASRIVGITWSTYLIMPRSVK